MSLTKVLVVFGTRPEATKMAPLVLALKQRSDIFTTAVCVTAQHREMLDQVLHTFAITPDYDLNLMQPRQTLSDISRLILEKMSPVIEDFAPDIILVHGDTMTTFMGALLAFFHKIRIGHVEAGLRTYDKLQPYPEEMTRQLTARLADYHFAPTPANRANLIAERIPQEHIFITGNTAIDAIRATVRPDYVFQSEVAAARVASGRPIITVTAHRRENLGEPLHQIALGLKDIALQHPELDILYPVHLNPAVQEQVRPVLGELSNVYLTDPLEMIDMHNLMARSLLILTDSGGLQEEAPALDKPVLVMRDVTERQEAEEAGTVLLVGPHRERIVAETNLLLSNPEAYLRMANAKNPFGDGYAAERIVEALSYCFGHTTVRPEDYHA